ncbi:MAG: hypothetical protein K2H52_09720 [Lachnospiraceae bacterium]|nr:hypothetical protein [Lachnospiraceae bacterium]MDE6183935.1 hypothetical protein [Lachnospiraceae bacterium]
MKQRIRIHKAEPNKGVLDYSYLLDAPAGKHGFVENRKGHFYFEDGTRARFLGFNVAARSNTPDHETADKMAERFASMGVNIIRLHAADRPIGDEPGSWSSCREAPLIDYESGSSRKFHREGLDRFDYFIAKLKEKGIYLHIDLIVAREFMEADELDYPGGVPSCIKRYTMYNERLIELQKEYAKDLLCHVNPYTGLALIDEPAVVTVQINNEDSAIKYPLGADADDAERVEPYREEVQRRFNHYLLMKYCTREQLKEAWTHEGVCALGDEEDPQQGTVVGIEGGFHQPVNDPNGSWDGECSPARYADFMEFGIYMNRRFYQMMKDYLHSLGVKVPIVTSNLVAGAADVYGHTDGGLMENNSYFNHPLLPAKGNTYLVNGLTEYVAVNPLIMQKGVGSTATSLLSLASVAIVGGKPFMLSEWNEYGEHPFHSTAFLHTVAYACLNDWDGLILYNHHTSEKWDDQPADEILSVFDIYNDPAVVCQWGFLASMFLKEMVSVAKNKVDVVFTQNDLCTLPDFHAMPTTFFPYIMSMRNVFLDGGDSYQGNADIAVNAGFLNGADLSDAKHSVYYAWSVYRDAMRCYKEKNRLLRAAKGTNEIQPGVHLGEQTLVFDEIAKIAGKGDYRAFAKAMDQAMKKWGLLSEETGYVDEKLISDTKEIVFDPNHFKYRVNTPYCACFSGAPDEDIVLSDRINVQARNERISLTLLPVGERLLGEAKEFVLTAMGTTGMDETAYNLVPDKEEIPFTAVAFKGKLYAETLEGAIHVKAETATLQILNPIGEVLTEIKGEKNGKDICFTVNGEVPGVQFHLSIN